MGCLWSKEFKVKEGVPGQDGVAMETFRKLHLMPKDIDALFTAFYDMDADTSHYIMRDEFCAYFYLEKTPLTVRMVKMMDVEDRGCLSFLEMVGLLWDFLSRDPKSLGSFAFHLFDQKNKGYISKAEVTELIEMLHHTTAAKHKAVNKIIADFCKKSVDVQTFHDYCHSHEEVCLSLFGLQHSLRERILGNRFWEEMTLRRSKKPAQMKVTYMQDLLSEYIVASGNHKKRMKKLDKKANNNRRRSSLMQLFNIDKSLPQHKEARIPTRQRAPRRQSITQTAIGMIRKKPVPGSKKKTKRNKAKVIQVHAIACPPSVKSHEKCSYDLKNQVDTSRLD